MPLICDTLDEALAPISDGVLLALPREVAGVPMAATRALIRRGLRGLRLVALPTSSLQADLLIGAGCVASVQTSAVTLGEAGQAPRFAAALALGAIAVTDSTCPAIHTALQAAEKGVPFMPLRGVLGSDILAHRPDWKVIDNPFAEAPDPILLVAALAPEFAAFHAACADSHGNVYVGRRRELATIAHASRRVLVTVERMVEGNLLDDERLAAGTINGVYIEAVALAPRGAWPSGLPGEYPPDAEHLAEYGRLARTDDGFRAYLDRFVLAGPARRPA